MHSSHLKARLMTTAAAALGLALGACGSAPHGSGPLASAGPSLARSSAKGSDAVSTSGSSAGALTCGGGSCSAHDAGASGATVSSGASVAELTCGGGSCSGHDAGVQPH